jgi:DNA-binding GntR family transcriptional regulator
VRPSTADIYRALRERITLLELAPGTRLTEEALASHYGVSRTPIREVLDRLHHERLVQQRPGSGATVAVIDTKEIRDVWAVRLKMSELIGDFVALPAPPELVDELRSLRADLVSVGAPADLGRAYNRYHELVLEVFSSETLRWIHDVLYHQTARVWLQFLPEMDLGAETDVMAEEIDLTIEAMRGRSGAALAEVRATHMHKLLARFNDHVARPIA